MNGRQFVLSELRDEIATAKERAEDEYEEAYMHKDCRAEYQRECR